MASKTIENYLKQIYLARQESRGKFIPMGRLANLMEVTPGTATTMVKALADAHLVGYEPRRGVKLSRAGEHLALHVLRRHRLVELLLVRVLKLDWSQVHEEAEEIEHAISERVLEAIDRLLGRPVADPHGDPIPTAGGKVHPQRFTSLATCPLDRPVRIVRILDQEPNFLRFVDQCGLTPQAIVRVQQRDPLADAVRLRIATDKSARCRILSGGVAARFLVRDP